VAEGHGILQVTLERDGALPADAVVNTWHFQAEAQLLVNPFETSIDGLLDRTEEFYMAIGTYLGTTLSGNVTAKLYDYADEEPRVPRGVRTFTISPGAGALPAEVAVCVSFEAAVASGQKRARRRGRVYIGPLSANMLPSPQTGAPDVRPDTGSVGAILTALEAFSTGESTEGFRLATFSPTEIAQGGSVGDAWNVVERIWADNAFDIQRRRGAAPTTRAVREL
jgi:hypothetical protein